MLFRSRSALVEQGAAKNMHRSPIAKLSFAFQSADTLFGRTNRLQSLEEESQRSPSSMEISNPDGSKPPALSIELRTELDQRMKNKEKIGWLHNTNVPPPIALLADYIAQQVKHRKTSKNIGDNLSKNYLQAVKNHTKFFRP